MFCPNCGTQNPDAAQACSKCSFHLKSVAAPKFKGTMLMMNQASIPGAAPPAGALPQRAPLQSPAAPPGAAPAPVMSKLKGTMVGVAPMAGAVRGFPMPAASAPPPGYNAPPPEPAASSFSPPVPQTGVNPLGGTMAAQNPAFGATYAAPASPPYGALPVAPPPADSPQGLPQGTALLPATGGAPHPAYGAPLPDRGPLQNAPSYEVVPPNPYNAPPPNPFAAPPPGYSPPPPAWGSHPGAGTALAPAGSSFAAALNPAGAGLAGPAPGPPLPSGSEGPQRRNPLMTFLLPVGVMVAGMVLSQVLVRILPVLWLAGFAIELVGGLWMLALTITMALEVKWVTQNAAFVWWPLFVPLYNLYWLCVLLPAEVTRAKQRLGVKQPTRPVVLYFFLSLYALASDVNDLVP